MQFRVQLVVLIVLFKSTPALTSFQGVQSGSKSISDLVLLTENLRPSVEAALLFPKSLPYFYRADTQFFTVEPSLEKIEDLSWDLYGGLESSVKHAEDGKERLRRLEYLSEKNVCDSMVITLKSLTREVKHLKHAHFEFLNQMNSGSLWFTQLETELGGGWKLPDFLKVQALAWQQEILANSGGDEDKLLEIHAKYFKFMNKTFSDFRESMQTLSSLLETDFKHLRDSGKYLRDILELNRINKCRIYAKNLDWDLFLIKGQELKNLLFSTPVGNSKKDSRSLYGALFESTSLIKNVILPAIE